MVLRELESRILKKNFGVLRRTAIFLSICRRNFGVFDVFDEELHAEFGP
jgi:hypothetical protein